MGTHVEKQPSSLAPEPQTKSDGKFLLNEKLSEAGVRLGRDLAVCAKTTISCTVHGTRFVTSWHLLPHVKITTHNRDADSVKNASFCTERLTVSPIQKTKKTGGKGSVAIIEEFQAIRFAHSRIHRAAEIQFEFHGMAQNPWDWSAACNTRKVRLRHVKIRERKGPSQGVLQRTGPREGGPYALKF